MGSSVRRRSRDGWRFGGVGIRIVGQVGHADTFDGFVGEGGDGRAKCVGADERTLFGFGDPDGVADGTTSETTAGGSR